MTPLKPLLVTVTVIRWSMAIMVIDDDNGWKCWWQWRRQYETIQYDPAYNTVQCNTILWGMQYSTVQCNTKKYNKVCCGRRNWIDFNKENLLLLYYILLLLLLLLLLLSLSLSLSLSPSSLSSSSLVLLFFLHHHHHHRCHCRCHCRRRFCFLFFFPILMSLFFIMIWF